MTDTDTVVDTTVDTAGAAGGHSTLRVLAALADLGETTAAAIAEHIGLGYSTVTPKLRAWEDSGHAQRFRNDQNQTLWRLTDTGRIATARTDTPAPLPDRPDTTEPAGTGDDPADAAPPLEPTGDQRYDDAPEAPAEPNLSPGDRPEPPSPEPTAGHAEVPSANNPAPADHAITTSDPDLAAGSPEPVTGAAGRREKGSLRAAILDILEANPKQAYKVSELCKLVDAANEGTSAKKASAGAVANAATKLVTTGKAVLQHEKPATYCLHSTDA